MQSTSESLLIRLKSEENSDAWTDFVQLYTPLIFYWARKIRLSEQDSADLAQDVMAIVFQKLPTWQYDPNKSFRGWLRKVTLNRHRELIRRKTIKTANGNGQLLKELSDPRMAESTWDADYEQQIVISAINMMKSDFAEKTWNALQEMIATGKPAAQVAREFGISVWTLYSAKNRLMTRLRKQLNGLLD